MTIEALYETFERRTERIGQKYERDYTRTFVALSDNQLEDPNTIRLHPACPRPWSFYVGINGFADLGAWCREVEVTQDAQDPYTWHITAQYSSRVERPDTMDPNPVLRPPVVTWDTVGVMIPVMYDNDDEPIVNSAKEWFDPPPEVEEPRMVLRIERNQLAYNAGFYLKFFNAVNSKTWLTFKRGMVRCMKIAGTRQFENGTLFWKVTFDFQIKAGTEANNDRDAWALRILDRGFRKLNSVTGKTEPIYINNALVTSPVLLNGSGQVLGVGADPVYKTFYVFAEEDFAQILPL